MAYELLSDVIIPRVFSEYLAQVTAEKSRFILSGALVQDAVLTQMLQGGGSTFDLPSWQDLSYAAANISSDAVSTPATPRNVATSQEVAVRLVRNQTWGSPDIVASLAGSDPMTVVAQKAAGYWARELNRTCIATLQGVTQDNVDNDSGDYVHDITDTFSAGTTDFSVEALIDALGTMGDAEPEQVAIVMHSVVYNKVRKRNLIDFVADSANPDAARVSTILGHRVFVDDTMPVSVQDYDTYLVGPGFLRWGVGSPKIPLELERDSLAGNGGGRENLTSRVEWAIHPVGHAYGGASGDGGPANTVLDDAASWNRVYSDRGQIPFAVLKTTEA